MFLEIAQWSGIAASVIGLGAALWSLSRDIPTGLRAYRNITDELENEE